MASEIMISTATADEMLVGFTRVCAAAGIGVSQDRAQAFLQAVAQTGADRRASVYWSGRATLCSSPDDLAVYDKAFHAWFADGRSATSRRGKDEPPRPVPQATLAPSDPTDGGSQDQLLRADASGDELLRHRDIASMSEAERARLAIMFDALVVRPPMRRSVRRRPHHRGAVDYRRTLRAQLKQGGEMAGWRWRQKQPRSRRVVFLIDVSGSMEPYADSLLRLAHRMFQAMPGRVEVFTVGTRLTRLTPVMRPRHADEALELAGAVVPDWSGGTRLGEVLRAFMVRWGRRGLARGAVVVIASDGWERGDPALLGDQVRQLQLLAHSCVWMNPHRGKSGYAPVQAGIAACLPWLDALVAGHSLEAFAELLEEVGNA